MGIPGLYGKLGPYGAPVAWYGSPPGFNGHLIIDGHAFAHWIYELSLKVHNKAKGARVPPSVPSYELIGAQSIQCLQYFEACGLYVKHIFFDGAIPLSKTKIKMARANDTVKKLRAFQAAVPQLGVTAAAKVSTPPWKRLQLPVVGFIVPAIIDALLESQWHDRFEVVPCEADARCLAPNCTAYDIILTGDSDLVIHASPARVMFFSEIEMRTDQKGRGPPMLSGKLYSSHALASRLGLTIDDFPRLAYHLHQNSKIPFATAVAMTKSDVPMSDAQTVAYTRHLDVYKEEVSLAAVEVMSRWSLPLQTLAKRSDPRVSNLVEQCLLSNAIEESGARVYLGMILDDPTRGSAWQASFATRQLCYSVLAVCIEKQFSMVEIDRRGTKAAEVDVPLLSRDTSHAAAQQLADHINQAFGSLGLYRGHTAIACWRLLAIRSGLPFEHSNEKRLLDKHRVLALMLGTQKQHSWEDLHLGAQAEGVLYSLRMLKQILGIVIEYRKSLQQHSRPLHSSILALSEALQPLPRICHLMSRPFAVLSVDMSPPYLQNQVAMFYAEEAPSTVPTPEHVKAGKKAKRSGKKDLSSTLAAMTLSENSYDVLSKQGSNAKKPMIIEDDGTINEGSSLEDPVVLD